MKRLLILRIALTFVLAGLTPVISANLFGWVYGRMIFDKGAASAEFILGWVAGLWFAPVVFIIGTALSVASHRKAVAGIGENRVQPGDSINSEPAPLRGTP